MAGSGGSINTNLPAIIALQNLNATQQSLQTVQKRISTGYNVADALDNGAIFSIAQGVRANITAETATNQELGSIQGLVQVANTAITNVSNDFTAIKSVLISLSDQSLSTATFNQFSQQFINLLGEVSNYVQGANYNGFNIVNGANSTVGVLRDVNGNVLFLNTGNINSAVGLLSSFAIANGTAASSALGTATGTFGTAFGSVGSQLNLIGASNLALGDQINFNTAIQNSLTTGLGSLVDADLASESAQLTALQIKQQLGTQTLSIANQTPNALLTLFR